MRKVEGAEAVRSEYETYLLDESKLSGRADLLAFPVCEADAAAFLGEMASRRIPVTVGGGRTGIVGGAVPGGDAILSTERMDRILSIGRDGERGEWFLTAEPGVILRELQETLEGKKWKEYLTASSVPDRRLFYPPDPTEASALLGATVATNASGARTFHYGPTRDYVRRLRVVLSFGEVLEIRRGEVFASPEGIFEVRRLDGDVLRIPVPSYRMPEGKNTAGYYAGPGMDLVDLFIGMEGTLGVITEVEVRLVGKPSNLLTAMVFLDSDREAVRFVRLLRGEIPRKTWKRKWAERVLLIEYFGVHALGLLLRKAREGAVTPIVHMPDGSGAAIFLETAFEEGELEGLLHSLEDLVREAGGTGEKVWCGDDRREERAFREIRHALPEAVNETIARNKKACPSLHKVGTDMAVPRQCLDEILSFYRGNLDALGIAYVIFGHIGDSHLHANILPRTEEELERAKALYGVFARKAVDLGGTVSGEHGIGKLKHPYLEILYGERGLREMASVKRALDPAGILCRGNLFPERYLEETE